ncbi:CMGC/CDK/CDC2 protein kinase [Mucor circinelloides 1006PhL]|uniref:Cyclin-dependent kinase 1 n=1 Tax=Mucor circinelloides f. circinelloides (strain 1006PhL) TaxID=1220926 RepID=S2K0I2_MUCC1|nr:CMGC/CDK/CDC2 protein kinase [Mucor circinelloides 1006PhL]
MSENIPPPIPRHNRTTKITVAADEQRHAPTTSTSSAKHNSNFLSTTDVFQDAGDVSAANSLFIEGNIPDVFQSTDKQSNHPVVPNIDPQPEDSTAPQPESKTSKEPSETNDKENRQQEKEEKAIVDKEKIPGGDKEGLNADGLAGEEQKQQQEEEEYDDLAHPYDLAGYQKLSKIGEGTYGVVFKARQKDSNKLVALKKVRLNLHEGVPTTTIREVAILKEMNHENIVKLVDMIQRDATIYLVFDFFDVDLRKYMDTLKRPGLTEKHIKSFMHQLLRGLHYCHSHRILHRDLKPQNLLIDHRGRLTIADLGLSRAFSIPMRTYTHQAWSLLYDMWSVGCIMAEMITMKPLFPGGAQIDQLFRIFRRLGTPNETIWPGISTLPDYNENFPPWKGADLRASLERYPSVIDLPDSAYDLLKSMLEYNPVLRISAVKAEEHTYFYDDITMLSL